MKRILLIEDDAFLIDVYTTKLKTEGFDIEVAVDGKEGLRKIKKLKPDLLLLDIVLPNIDGWGILEEIKKTESLKDLKVIVLSNLAQKEDVEKGLALGATKYLIKSYYTPSQIVEEIKQVLK